MYRTRAITTRGLYIFNLIFFHKPRFILQTIYVLKNENSSFLKPKIRGLYTRVVTDQERAIMVRVR